MAWWARLVDRRSWQLSQLQSWADMGVGSGPTASSIIVTPENSLSVPAVFACCQVLAQDLARTPIKLRQQIATDTFEDAVDHPLFEILHALPNPEMTAYQVKAALMWSLLTYGQAFAEIVRVDGRITALWPLDARAMRVDRTPARVKRWTYTPLGQTYSWLFDASAPPILELVQETPLNRCRELVGTALALQEYTGHFFANGARPTGILQAPHHISQAQAQDLKERWLAIMSRSGSRHRGVGILEGGIEFKPIAADNDSSQLNETWSAINQMIAGTFRVPTWKIGDLTKTSYANMEAGELAYVTSTLDPFFQLWEDALRRDLLTSRQFGQFSIQFDRSALLRSDTKSLHESLAVGRNTGIYSVNDCRKKLGENPIPGGDDYLVNSALQPIGAPRDPTIV
jgi:HK97 family phage portal protein